MTDKPSELRTYSDEEAGKILRRATELQRSQPADWADGGLRLDELEEIAREVGIDPRYVRRAASELALGTASSFGSRLAGGPLVVTVERTAPVEIDPRAFEGLLPLIQSVSIGQGTGSVVGRTLTWVSRSDTNTSSQQVTVSARDGETVIRAEERLSGLAGALHGGLVGGVGGGVGIGGGTALGAALGSVAISVAMPIGVAGLAYLAARSIYSSQVRGRRERLEALVEQITQTVTMTGPRPELEEGGEG